MEIIEAEDISYPQLLKNIRKKPKTLYVEGDISVLNLPSITVVGSRNMTDYGKKMTQNIVKQLTLNNMCIISGMAIGIDAVAHTTCIENGGKTVAVLGSGLNKIFPAENKWLFKKILKTGGCIISEYPPDTIAQKRFFPQRNRIVSGLSLATVVIESTYRSGTSITANFAFEQGKKVFCVPNSVGNKNSAGIINLLKKGAILATSGSDILYELGIIKENVNFEKIQKIQKQKKVKLLEQEQLKDLDNLAKELYLYIKENKIVNSEVVSNELKISLSKVNMYLTILELKGLIVNKSGMNFMISDEYYV